MKKFSHFRGSGPLFALLLLGAAVPVSAQTEFSFTGDSYFTGIWAPTYGFEKLMGANMRWGNNGMSGDWEYGVVSASDVPTAQGQTIWTATRNFRFVFDGVLASLTLGGDNGGTISSSFLLPDPVSTLAFRVSASSANSASMSNLRVSYGGLTVFRDLLSVDEPTQGQEYWILQDTRLVDGFVIEGDVWLGSDGKGSVPMAQVKVGTSHVTPEPATLLLLLTGLLGVTAVARSGRTRA